MNEELKFIVEINPRTKEKKKIKLEEYQIAEGVTIADLITQHRQALAEIERLKSANKKLALAVINIQKSLQVQIVDIKEELK